MRGAWFAGLALVVGCAEDVPPAEFGVDEAPPPGVRLEQTALVPGAEASFRVVGVAPGDTVHFARSSAGLGQGPCFPTMGGVCLDLLQPQLMATRSADHTGTALLRVTLPPQTPPQFVYTQAIVESFAGTIATNSLTAPVLRGALDDDGDGFCEGQVCHDPAATPGDCDDTNSDVFPGQTAWFSVPYDAGGVASYDYDCDGVERMASSRTYTCRAGQQLACRSHTDGWDGPVPACGEQGTWGEDCFNFPLPGGLGLCVAGTQTLRDQACR